MIFRYCTQFIYLKVNGNRKGKRWGAGTGICFLSARVLYCHTFFLPKLLYVEEGPRNCFIVTWFNSVNIVNYLFHFERIGDFRGHAKKTHLKLPTYTEQAQATVHLWHTALKREEARHRGTATSGFATHRCGGPVLRHEPACECHDVI